MPKFIHAADLHLGSPLRGLERYEGAPVNQVRNAPLDALQKLVDLAIAQQVSLVILAGDIYDGNGKDYKEVLYFIAQMCRLDRANIPVYLIAGNHDAESKMTRKLPYPDNVHAFDHKQPHTLKLSEEQVALHGLSFAKPAVSENVALDFPAAVAGYLNIGILHTSLDAEAGGEHACYAPCKLEDLLRKDYQYWALGHIHQRAIRHEQPHIVYSGNIQGRHIRESGAKGCYLVEWEGEKITSCQFAPLDVLRWEVLYISAAGISSLDDLLDQFKRQAAALCKQHDDLPLALRVVFTGSTELHPLLSRNPLDLINQVRAIALAAGSEQFWVEKVKLETSPIQQKTALADDGPLAEVTAIVAHLQSDAANWQEINELLSDVTRKLPDEIGQPPDGLLTSDPAWLTELTLQAQAILQHRLQEGAAR